MFRTLSFIRRHPVTARRPFSALARFVRWQIESRLRKEVEFQWIAGSKLIVRNGMTGATGNVYCGLHEFVDMAFLLHLLRPGDLFIDAGANIGSYSVLASAVCGSDVIAIEPDPETMSHLRRNIDANGVDGRVELVEAALGANEGTIRFTVGLDTVNHVASKSDPDAREVALRRLDRIVGSRKPAFIKMDVEGYEAEVLAGAAATLSSSSLLAIQTESNSQQVREALSEAGFTRSFYDPVTRRLQQSPTSFQASNALYLRDAERCQARLHSAARRSVLGMSL